MPETRREPPPHPPAPREPRGDFFVSLVSAALFLYVGFGLGLVGTRGDALYDNSVAAFTWGARIIGIGLLVTAALSLFRWPGAVLLDLALAAIGTVGCLSIGLIWLLFNEMEGVLLLLFGGLNGSATRSAWYRWQASRNSAPPPPDPPA